jgi:hypothetical protein
MRALSALFAIGCVGAAEFVVRDAQVELVALPTSFRYDLSGSSSSTSGNDGFTSGTGLRIGTRWSLSVPGSSVGALAGADVVADGFTYSGGGGMAAYGLRGALGGGWAISDRWQVLGEIAATYGRANLDLPSTASAPANSSAGSYLGYDARLSAGWQVARGLQVELSAGWLQANYALDGAGVAIDLQRSGLFIGLGLSWRIDDAPPTLE